MIAVNIVPNSQNMFTRLVIILTIVLLLVISITGCRFNSEFKNSEKDKKDAEAVTIPFFGALKDENFAATRKYFSKEFLKVTSDKKLQEIFELSTEKLGRLKSWQLSGWETKRVEGSNSFAEYHLVYNTSHEKHPAMQIFRLVREKDEIKIISYRIESEAFLK